MTKKQMPKVDRKARLKIPPNVVKKRPPEERTKDFNEIYIYYDLETAKREAERCIQCPGTPCVKACPIHNDIPGAFWLLEQGDVSGAANRFRETSVMPEICGRICPQERLCEGSCVVGKNNLPVHIGKLEAFLADYQRKQFGFPKQEVAPAVGQKVACVGAGPASIQVAEDLITKGYEVTVYDYWPEPGGLLIYGIPNFKLDKQMVYDKIAFLEDMGVKFVPNTKVGEDVTLDELFEQGYDAVFLGVGAPVCATQNVPGEDLKGIYYATDYLVRGNLPPERLPEHQREPLVVGKRVAVIGGGDTAMDCVRTSVRLPGVEEVTCVYRRTEAEMPGRAEERANAKEEGVKFEFLTVPVRYIGNDEGWVSAMECQRMELGEPDSSGRRRPIPIEGTNFIQEVDTVVLALGYWPDPLLGEKTENLKTHKWGLFVVDEATGATSREGVFAGGDAVRGADLVVTALASAKIASHGIDEYLRAKRGA
jgi:glutamate synthase (NADPH/NADH) small chain